MIFVFQKIDVHNGRSVLSLRDYSEAILIRVGLKHFKLTNSEQTQDLSLAMKAGKMARFLNQNDYCPIEFSHIGSEPSKFIKKIEDKAIKAHNVAPRYIWKSEPDQRMRPPEGFNCRCTMTPLVDGFDQAMAEDVVENPTHREVECSQEQKPLPEVSTGLVVGPVTAIDEEVERPAKDQGEFEQLKGVLSEQGLSLDGEAGGIKPESPLHPELGDPPEGATHFHAGSDLIDPCWVREDSDGVFSTHYSRWVGYKWVPARGLKRWSLTKIERVTVDGSESEI